MTEAEIQAALDRAQLTLSLDYDPLAADVEALVAEVTRLRARAAELESWLDAKDRSLAETAVLLHQEREQLRARVSELEGELHQSRHAWVEQQKHLRAQLATAVEALENTANVLRAGAFESEQIADECDAVVAKLRGGA